MAFETAYECNGCAECIGCGRKNLSYKVLLCDNCLELIENRAYPVEDKYLCGNCALETLDSISVDCLLDGRE